MPAELPELPFPRADWHIHASFYRTVNRSETARIEPIVQRCADLGRDMVGIGEHVNDQPKHPFECFADLASDLRAATLPIPAYLSAEADIVDDSGNLSVPPDIHERTGLDCLIASAHGACQYHSLQEYLDNHHRRIMAAIIADNRADVIGHPWHHAKHLVAKAIITEWRFELVPETMIGEMIDALRDNAMAVEINHRSVRDFRDPAYRAFVRRVRDQGAMAAVGSDAHDLEGLERALAINAFLAEMGFTDEQLWRPARARTRASQ